MGQVQHRVVDAQLGQDVVGRLLDDRGPRVVVLVDPVTEPHEPGSRFLVLHPGHEVLRALARLVQGAQHLQHRLVRPTVQRAEQGIDPGRDRREEIGV
jgi:hypothetical protein